MISAFRGLTAKRGNLVKSGETAHAVSRMILLNDWASNGFDGVVEVGEASRCDTLIAKLKLNANRTLAPAA